VIRRVLHVLGEVLATLGVLVVLFAAYQVLGTGLYTEQAQDDVRGKLAQSWGRPLVEGAPGEAGSGSPPRPAPAAPAPAAPAPAAPAPAPPGRDGPADRAPGLTAPPAGQGLAVLRLPALDERAWAVVEGVDGTDLRRGPGHYPGTALPGEVGNVVLSGHRTTYGAPFAHLDRLLPGDPIVVETRDTYFTYAVTGAQVVAPTATAVILPVPGEPAARPTRRLLTLTTCHPRYSARQRLIVYAELRASSPVTAGPPAALAAPRTPAPPPAVGG